MKALRFAQGVLALGALLYALLGVWFLASPGALSVVGLAAESAAASTEIRATYGGLELGMGLFLAWCCWGNRERLRIGLVALALTTGGFGFGRAVGLVLDRPPESIFLTLVGVEIVTTLAAAVAAKLLSGVAPEAPAAEAGGA